jgi:hypothetical protein
MESNYKGVYLILLLGFLTPIMMLFVPVEGGGVSLIFVITVPIFIGISIILSIIYFYLDSWKVSQERKKNILFIFSIVLIALSLLLYPYR